MKKLSFSLPSKPSNSKPPRKSSQSFAAENRNESSSITHQQFVTEFDGSENPSQQIKTYVIPPKENEWRPFKKMKNLELPLQSSNGDDLKFELEAPSMADSLDSNMSYGLNIRQSAKSDASADVEGGDKSRSGESVENVLLQKLRYDLKRLPEDRGLEEFDDVPIEGFGAALLAGYGWFEGRGIGKNPKGEVEVKQYERRTAKEGLGFINNMDDNNDKKDKEKNDKRDRIENKREKDRDGSEFFVGDEVRIVAGKYVGFKGRILEILQRDLLVLKVLRGGEEVEVRASDVAVLGSKEEERYMRKLKELQIKDHKVNEKIKERKRDKAENGTSRGIREERRKPPILWLTNHIRVRVISQDIKRGKLYLKKGRIVDVVGPRTCDISMDESRELIQGVDQEVLETALPRHGGPVLVLYGEHKGAYGSLVERDMEKETGIVRDADTHSLLSVRLEQIAEYVGDPSDLGY